jgi:hypothetical protein
MMVLDVDGKSIDNSSPDTDAAILGSRVLPLQNMSADRRVGMSIIYSQWK